MSRNEITLSRGEIQRDIADATLNRDRSSFSTRQYYQGMIDLLNGLIMQMDDPSLRDDEPFRYDDPEDHPEDSPGTLGVINDVRVGSKRSDY